jgi:hypothetical protein
MKLENISKDWLISKLEDWRETFRDEEENEGGEDENKEGWDNLTLLIESAKEDTTTKGQYEEIIFHLCQQAQGDN